MCSDNNFKNNNNYKINNNNRTTNTSFNLYDCNKETVILTVAESRISCK